MEDPTIFDILSSVLSIFHLAKSRIDAGETVEEILEQEWFKEKERQLKADIVRARFKSKPLSHFIMTINMNESSLGPGTAGNRRQLLTILFRIFFPSVIFSQEQNGEDEEFITRLCQLEVRRNGTEAAVFWNGDAFEGTAERLKPTDRRIIRIRDEVQRQFGDIDLSEVLSRIVMVKLKTRLQGENANQCFLAVSWHGRHGRLDLSKKRRVCLGLQEFVKKVSDEEGNIPFVIGGDFNLNTLDEEVPLSDGVTLASYPLSPRSEQLSDNSSPSYSPNFIPYKDNFMWYGGIQVEWTRPIDFTSRSEQTRPANDLPRDEQDAVEAIPVDASRGNVDQLLDHDPVIAVLTLRNREEEDQNGEEEDQNGEEEDQNLEEEDQNREEEDQNGEEEDQNLEEEDRNREEEDQNGEEEDQNREEEDQNGEEEDQNLEEKVQNLEEKVQNIKIRE